MVTSIKSMRMNPPGPQTPLTLENVVIVQVVTASRHGDVWVQDSGGGMYSGIHLYCNYGGSNPSCAMTKAQIDALARGMVVNVSGKYDPYRPSMPANAPALIEIGSPMITPTGATAAPVAITVTADEVAKDTLMMPSAEPYKGVYVRVMPGPFTISDVRPMEFQGTCPIGDGGGMASFGVEATGQGKTLALALTFHKTAANPGSFSWCVPGCFTCATNVLSNQTFTSISGVVEPASNPDNNSIYLSILPTVDGDLAASGT
jgi:hypothetical protein